MQAPKGVTAGMSSNVWHVLQIAGDSEVKAQIKLRINTATSQPVVIIRSFQVRLQLHGCASKASIRAYTLLCCPKMRQKGCTEEDQQAEEPHLGSDAT